MGHGEYELSELSRLAGITVRTVRYYIQQGLLPGPGERGPGARYGQGHLDRLRLIKLMRDEDVPLAKIRALLEALDDEGVKATLERYAELQPPPGSSALEYVRALRRGAPAPSTEGPARDSASRAPSSPRESWLWSDPHRRMNQESLAAAASIQKPAAAARSQWERIALAPDVELHVRRPLSRRANRQVERLLRLAHELFSEEEGQ